MAGSTGRTPGDAAPPPRPRLPVGLVAGFVVVKLGLHLVALTITPYSVYRDELLYLAMGQRLRFLAMDFPPFIAVAARGIDFLPGDSLLGVRLLAALAGTALLVLSASIVRELGGGRFAQAMALLAMLFPPLFLRSATLYQPVVFDQLWWTLALYALLRIGRRGAPSDWYLLGLAGGVGLLTKFSIGFVAAGVGAALVVTRERRWLATRWPSVAAGLALLVGSASIVGQIRLGFPVLDQMTSLRTVQLERVTTAEFLGGQVMLLGPSILLALAGLGALLAGRGADRTAHRAVGIAALVPFLLLLALRGKPYYAGPIYPLLIAAGAVRLERAGRFRKATAAALAAAVIAAGLVALPMGLPVLPPEPMARYAAWLGVTQAVRANTGEVLPLPQDYADMLGWEELVAEIAAVHHDLPREERARVVIVTSNYGEAGAVDVFGPRHGLPSAVSPVGSYWFLGPGALPGEVVIVVGEEPDDVGSLFAEFTVVRRVENPWGVPEQQRTPIGVGRSPHRTLQQLWPTLAGRH